MRRHETERIRKKRHRVKRWAALLMVLLIGFGMIPTERFASAAGTDTAETEAVGAAAEFESETPEEPGAAAGSEEAQIEQGQEPARAPEEAAQEDAAAPAEPEALQKAGAAAPNPADFTPQELAANLNLFTPEALTAYIDGLSDDAYDAFIEQLSDEEMMALMEYLSVDMPTTLATNYYIGYAKRTDDFQAVDYALVDAVSGAGVKKFYLAAPDVYNQYAGYYSSYASAGAAQKELLAKSELAYCFNFYDDPPGGFIKTPDDYSPAEYAEIQSATPTNFINATSTHRRYPSANTLYQKVMAVAMNGYPNDAAGIQATYGLTDDQFRFITQYAIWYYTDSISLRFTTSGSSKLFYVYADDTNTWLTGTNGYYRYSSSNWANAYNALVNSTLDSSTLDTSHINLYKKKSGSGFQNLLNVGQEFPPDPDPDPPTPTVNELKVRIRAKKMIDSGKTPIGDNRFTFLLTGHGQALTAESDANGDILFPELVFTEAGTYTFTIEEVTDDRDGVSFDFDKNKKTVTVTISEHDLQTYDPDAVYYAFEELSEDFEYYYYVDTVPGNKGIVMYCTYQGVSGPQDPTGYTGRQPKDQTYKAVINPTVSQIETNHWVQQNNYGDQLNEKLKKLFYYLASDDAKKISNGDKQALVWSATGKSSSISSIRINGRAASSNPTTVLNNIYETVTLPATYNLVFFIPTGTQAAKFPQPLAAGYGAAVDSTSGEVVFNNTSKAANSLKIGKTVSGSGASREKEFNFTLSLMDNNYRALTGTFPVTAEAITGVAKPNLTSITLDSRGRASVKLKHGQSITITGLPDGYYYSVVETEANQDGYTTTLTADANSNLSSAAGAKGAVDVAFKNHKDAEPLSYTAEVKATKTLDGKAPADGQFTFVLKNAEGTEVGRKTNDGNGEVVFPLTFTEPGTYTYTIEEVNDGQAGIVYDTEPKTVTVTVGSEVLQEIVNGDSFTGSHVSEAYYITVNGTTQLDVYCIDGSAGYPGGSYEKVLNPDSAQLAAQVTANNYGGDLAENMRKLLYYFDTHSTTEKVRYSTLTKAFRQELIWCLTGNAGQQHSSYTDVLNDILAESNPPDNYTVVMFASTNTPKKQPVIAGYAPASQIVYNGSVNPVEFKNYTKYALEVTKNNQEGLKLSGAGFKLFTDRDCTKLADVFIDETETTLQKDAADEQLRTDGTGKLHFYGLQAGTYYLKEVRTPTGYAILQDPVTVVVSKDGKVTVNGYDKTPAGGSKEITVTVTDTKVSLTMPQSGFGGDMPFVITAMIAMTAAFGGFLIFRRNRRKLCQSKVRR